MVTISACTAIGAWQWLVDPETMQVSFLQSLYNHLFFTLSSLLLGNLRVLLLGVFFFSVLIVLLLFAIRSAVLLFMMGIHKRVVCPSIVASRARQVLTDFNMSCDDTGKLILRPRPAA